MHQSRKTETESSLVMLNQAETVETLTNMQTAQSAALVGSSISDWLFNWFFLLICILLMGTAVGVVI